ncbi:hypothetical protein A0H81_11463 [Grifola frondosa]|uniref:Cyanovirin-N domain-containing protein n=1 Tax=Grifola frondosa TaxID=5627 RepID=A0A1C7M0K2_GRIFR|nr:hypothetical protein A0H81_11463 [Grifola frondosa]
MGLLTDSVVHVMIQFQPEEIFLFFLATPTIVNQYDMSFVPILPGSLYEPSTCSTCESRSCDHIFLALENGINSTSSPSSPPFALLSLLLLPELRRTHRLASTTVAMAGTATVSSSVDLNQCVGNIGGTLECWPNGGNYYNSCNSCKLQNGDILSCDCGSGTTLKELNNCVSNRNGQLTCP